MFFASAKVIVPAVKSGNVVDKLGVPVPPVTNTALFTDDVDVKAEPPLYTIPLDENDVAPVPPPVKPRVPKVIAEAHPPADINGCPLEPADVGRLKLYVPAVA